MVQIVDWEAFARLPAGTIFSFYEPCILRDLCRKDDTIFSSKTDPIDFFYISVIGDQIYGPGSEIRCAEAGERWGAFDYDQQFAIYDADAVKTIGRVLGLIRGE